MSLIYLTTGRSKDQRALEVFTASWTEDPEWVDGQALRFEAKPEDRIRLNLTLEAFEADLGSRLAVVAGFADDQLMRTAVLMALHYGSGQVTELADLLILSVLKQDARLMSEADRIFDAIDPDLLETARMYLLAGGNAKLAAEQLYLHRNTFNYRLNKFISKTRLDLKEPLQARFLQTYLLLKSS